MVLRRDIARIAEVWSGALDLSGGPYLGGAEFGGADAFFAPVAFRAQSYGLDLGRLGNDYVARLLALPAMREWYDAAIAETFRDPDHEDEVQLYSRVIEDFRRSA